MYEKKKCPLCGSITISSTPLVGMLSEYFECPQCGNFELQNPIYFVTQNFLEIKHLLAGFLFETNHGKSSRDYPKLSTEKVKEILKSPLIPRKISEKPIKLLKYLNDQTTEFGELLKYPPAAMYAKSEQEACNIYEDLLSKGFIVGSQSRNEEGTAITLLGMAYLGKYERDNITKPDYAFVAMWFSKKNPFTENVWKNIIEPACLEAGYLAVRVSERHFNGIVVDDLLAIITESSFAVVDYSGYRGDVYYEAGYAKGLGKEVISMCHESWFNNIEEKNHTVYFDENRNNFIVWETGKEEDARIELTNIIRTTVGKGNYKPE